MKNKIQVDLNNLEQQILTQDISKEARATEEWGGADVIIKGQLDENIIKWLGDQPLVISSQNTEPRRRAVITEYCKELSWLFQQLKQIFSGRVDHVSKYDFYGLLAQSAIDFLEANKESKDVKSFLLTVLNTAKGFLEK